MTTLWQHIEDLDDDAWAELTKRAATAAVAANEHPPTVLAAVAAMTEHELVGHRSRVGPTQKRLSPVMRLVEADHLRALAQDQARQAHQDTQDAQVAAALARTEAEQSVHEAT